MSTAVPSWAWSEAAAMTAEQGAGRRLPGEAELCVALARGRRARVRASLAGPAQADVVVAVLGGISATHRVADSPAAPGWWRALAGPGRAFDTRRIAVLGMEHVAPDAFTPTTADQARALTGVLDAFGIPRIDALVGASYGGMVGLAFARDYPRRVGRLVVISAAHRNDPLATAWRAIQRRVLRLGLAHGCVREAAVLARALAMATYRSREEFAQRFAGPPTGGPDGPAFPVERYLLSRGEAFAERASPLRFLRLSESVDLHDVEPAQIHVPAHFIASRTDQLVPLALMQELATRYAGPAELSVLDSIYGHDAFLKEDALLAPILIHECRSKHP